MPLKIWNKVRSESNSTSSKSLKDIFLANEKKVCNTWSKHLGAALHAVKKSFSEKDAANIPVVGFSNSYTWKDLAGGIPEDAAISVKDDIVTIYFDRVFNDEDKVKSTLTFTLMLMCLLTPMKNNNQNELISETIMLTDYINKYGQSCIGGNTIELPLDEWIKYSVVKEILEEYK